MPTQSTAPWKRIATWITVSCGFILMRFPFYAFLSDHSHRLGIEPWDQNFKTWCVWDCPNYGSLGMNYTVDNVVYFPGYPWTIHALRFFIPDSPMVVPPLILSNFFSFLALALVFCLSLQLRHASRWKDHALTDGRAWLTTALMAWFPMSHFWSSGYAEPEQLCAFAAVLLLVLKKRWLPACAVAGAASLIRIQCCWLVAVMCVFSVILYRREKLKLAQSLAHLCAPFTCFLAWQWIARGDPLLFIHKMSGNGRGFNVLDVLLAHRPRWDLSWILLMLSYLSGFQLIKRPDLHWRLLGVMTWVLALMPIAFGGFGWGYGRYVSCNIGLFVFGGEWLLSRPWLAFPTLGWSVFRMGVEIEGWTLGKWRG